MIPSQRAATVVSVVVDASAMVDVLTGQPNRDRLVELLLDDRTALHVPALLDLEVVSVARRLELAGRIAEQRTGELLDDFADLGISRHPLPPLRTRVWSLRDWVRVADDLLREPGGGAAGPAADDGSAAGACGPRPRGGGGDGCR